MISGLSSWTVMISTGSYNTYWVGFEANSFAHATSPPTAKLNMAPTFYLSPCSLEKKGERNRRRSQEIFR